MTEFIIVVTVISIMTGAWAPASRQPYLGRSFGSAAACEAAAGALRPLPGTQLVCLPRDAPKLFEPPQAQH
ncbi:hypothetical protein GCM10011504_22400 [Siccirubricoccus deserti]|uniref:Uncharacterized protein n=1 Tax=Siccirubricoccus deserti TaxID=2013562 RepID=A0A9X0UGW0_9PROT|nr:hypothetical protein [Siccirubricoccus deserti]MBC4015655.1 hypothetical protein [Siccirubricoccus deserti]GGC43491.1 hypothetical protein GCM10011504_22400 [Siccirubricoccus deserti]